ncbi:hypothetical protein CAOG_00077 [Capsaspora owczarzaki ATCC 30864]|nr:hypothetical protein CAOG_00077 [Capsaspora owczarzaki ATCC 30864]|eukprot:XP_004364948.1 hypothetical protein CAOG_00077 [Capsaspora owczarzaki ATCC 30864]
MTLIQRELYDRVKNNAIGLLSLWREQIGDAGAETIAEALKENQKVVKLILGENRIGHVGTLAIAEAIRVNTTLTQLSLNANHTGDLGARAIAEALVVNKFLQKLFLGDNQIGDAGTRAIAEALKVNKTLTSLSLERNQIGNDGAQSLAEALRVNTTVTRLDLEQNQIGDAGARALAEALKENTTLTLLELNHNAIGDAGMEAVYDAWDVNATVEDTRFENPQISPLALAMIPRFTTAEDSQTVFGLLTRGLELENQSACLPLLPDEVAERILDEACYWPGVQRTERAWFHETNPTWFLRVTVPKNTTGDSIRVKAIQIVRERKRSDSAIHWVVRDELGAVRYEGAVIPTVVGSTIQLLTIRAADNPHIRQMREGWEVLVRPSEYARDVRFESLYVGYI